MQEVYWYLVSVLGVTGARETVSLDALDLLHRARNHTSLPLALGFGISTPEQVKTCARAGADGVIVGSAIVDIVEKHLHDQQTMTAELTRYVHDMNEPHTSRRNFLSPIFLSPDVQYPFLVI